MGEVKASHMCTLLFLHLLWSRIVSRVTVMVVFKGLKGLGAPQELNLLKRRGLLPVYLLGTLLWALVLAEWTALGMVTEEDL